MPSGFVADAHPYVRRQRPLELLLLDQIGDCLEVHVRLRCAIRMDRRLLPESVVKRNFPLGGRQFERHRKHGLPSIGSRNVICVHDALPLSRPYLSMLRLRYWRLSRYTGSAANRVRQWSWLSSSSPFADVRGICSPL